MSTLQWRKLERSAGDHKAAISDMLQGAITNKVKQIQNDRKSQKRNRGYKVTQMEILKMKPTYYSWNKAHLVIVHNPISELFDLRYMYLIEDLQFYIHDGYWSVVCFCCGVLVWLW